MLHQNQRIADLLNQLLKELNSYERNTKRQYTLFLAPHSDDEPMVVAINGRVQEPLTAEVILLALAEPFKERHAEIAARLHSMAVAIS